MTSEKSELRSSTIHRQRVAALAGSCILCPRPAAAYIEGPVASYIEGWTDRYEAAGICEDHIDRVAQLGYAVHYRENPVTAAMVGQPPPAATIAASLRDHIDDLPAVSDLVDAPLERFGVAASEARFTLKTRSGDYVVTVRVRPADEAPCVVTDIDIEDHTVTKKDNR